MEYVKYNINSVQYNSKYYDVCSLNPTLIGRVINDDWLHYEKKSYTMLVNNSSDINNTNNPFL